MPRPARLADAVKIRHTGGMSSTGQKLMDLYRAMHLHFGHQAWWPGDTPLEICIGAILTQNTNWTNVEKALANLARVDCLSVSALHAIDREQLAQMIRPAGYYNIKARRLMNFIAHVHDHSGDDIQAFLDRPVDVLREDLLSINGVGRETADSMILYAARKPTFVIDAYTFRIMCRHHLLGPEDDYESAKYLFESNLPEDVELWNDYHAQLVAVGKNFCRPKCKCDQCPLRDFEHETNCEWE